MEEKASNPDYIVEVFITEFGKERTEPVIKEELVKINVPDAWEAAKFTEDQKSYRGRDIDFTKAVVECLFKNNSNYKDFLRFNEYARFFFEGLNSEERPILKKMFEKFGEHFLKE